MIRKRTFPRFGLHVTDDVVRVTAGRDFMCGIPDGAVRLPPIAGKIRHAKVRQPATASMTCLAFDLPVA